MMGLTLLKEEIKGISGHNNIEKDMTINLLDDMIQEIPQEGSRHNCDLYISTKYEDHILTNDFC